MEVHVNQTSADLPRDPTSCLADVREGGLLLLTLSQNDLTVIPTIHSTMVCFLCLVFLSMKRKRKRKRKYRYL